MWGNYRHINEYEKEILEIRRQGKSKREICEKYGFSIKQLTYFVTRYNQKRKKLSAGISIKPKGRPRKNGTELPPSIQQSSKLTQLQIGAVRSDQPSGIFVFCYSIHSQ